MFKFNFNQNEENGVIQTDSKIDGDQVKCREHELRDVDLGIGILEAHGLKYVISSEAVNKMQEKPDYLKGNSDLVKNVYEGGMKIWECSLDFLQYLSSNEIKCDKVLELGCGAALPGIFALKNTQDILELHLQDFNPEVIEFITMQNVLLNSNGKNVRLFSGDWADFLARMTQESTKYDLILTSETIYEESNYPKLHAIFDKLLSEHGKILLGAKIHYFGVGGGLRSFEKSLEKTGKWTFKTVFENCDTVKREIIEIKRV